MIEEQGRQQIKVIEEHVKQSFRSNMFAERIKYTT